MNRCVVFGLSLLFTCPLTCHSRCDSVGRSRCSDFEGDGEINRTFTSLRNRFKCVSSGVERFRMPGVSWTYMPNNCLRISLGHWSWSITPLPTCYSHFLLWGGINLTHYAFKQSQWGEFSAKRRYRWWLLHSNSVPVELAEVALSGPPRHKANQTSFFHRLIERPDWLLVLTASVLAATPLPHFTTLIKIHRCNKKATQKVCS